jgi:hypothetical protein
MLRDRHHRINTIIFRHGKPLPYRQRVRALVVTSFKAILLHHLKPVFCDVGDTFPLPSRSGRRLPAVEENATNDRQRRDEVW